MATPSSIATSAACYCFDVQKSKGVAIYLLASKAGLLGSTQAQLATAAKCYCYSDGASRNIIAYLLAVQAGVSTSTPSAIASSAACFCYDDATFRGVSNYLLSQIAGIATPPSGLALAANCYCFDDEIAISVAIYLLTVINGLTALTPSALEALAKCFCFGREAWKKVVTYLLSTIGGGPGPPPSNGLLANLTAVWEMEEATATNRLDSSGNGHTFVNNGNIAQTATHIQGSFGAISMNSSTAALINADGPLLATTKFTALCWVFPTATQDGFLIFGRWGTPERVWTITSAGGFFEFVVRLRDNSGNTGIATSTVAYPLNKWSLIVVAYDSVNSVNKISVNGETFQTGVNAEGSMRLSAMPLAIFNSGDITEVGSLTITFDETAIWENRVFTQSDVTTLINGYNFATQTGSPLFFPSWS